MDGLALLWRCGGSGLGAAEYALCAHPPHPLWLRSKEVSARKWGEKQGLRGALFAQVRRRHAVQRVQRQHRPDGAKHGASARDDIKLSGHFYAARG